MILQQTSLFSDSQVNISLLSEQFESDGALVTLKWIHQNFYLYNVSVVPHLKYSVVETAVIQLKINYNTFYNVTITVLPPCGENNTIDYTTVSKNLIVL